MKTVIHFAFGVAFGSLRAWFVIFLLASHSASALDINWDAVTNLSATGQDAEDSQVALSSDGTKATAVWLRDDGSNYIIQSRSATISEAIVSDCSLFVIKTSAGKGATFCL